MKIGIVGLGYVGLPLAVAFAEAGHDVVGLDVDPAKVEALNGGRSYVEDVADSALSSLGERLRASGDYAELGDCEAVVICVPTPLTSSREPDLTYLVDAATSLAAVLRSGQLVVLESTTYPGTTREQLAPILAGSGLSLGENLFVAFSPERIDPGRTDYTIRTTPKLVGGLTPACTERARDLYSLVCDKVVVLSTPEAAELSKLLENVFRSVNIAFVNELAQLCDRLGIDVWEVIDAASTKPFGFMRFDPGPGMGGHCLPVDPFYLAFKAREQDFYPEFIELAGKVNQAQPAFCVERIERILNQRSKPVKGSTDPGPRRQLQVGQRRHPRVAGADHPAAAERAGGRRLLPRPLRARSARVRAQLGRPRQGSRRGGPGRDRYRPPGSRLRRRRRQGDLHDRLPRRHPWHRVRGPGAPLGGPLHLGARRLDAEVGQNREVGELGE